MSPLSHIHTSILVWKTIQETLENATETIAKPPLDWRVVGLNLVQCASRIKTILTWLNLPMQWWFDSWLKPIFTTYLAAVWNDACFKIGQKWHKKSHFAWLVEIRDTLCIIQSTPQCAKDCKEYNFCANKIDMRFNKIFW